MNIQAFVDDSIRVALDKRAPTKVRAEALQGLQSLWESRHATHWSMEDLGVIGKAKEFLNSIQTRRAA